MAIPTAPSSALESLSGAIHGFRGYEQSDHRNLSDQQLRHFLVMEIQRVLIALDALPPAEQEEDKRRLGELAQSTRRKLTTICSSLKDPTYMGQEFFSTALLHEKRVQRIYFQENDMLEELAGIIAEIAALANGRIEKESIEDHFLHIGDFIDNLNQALFERECLILGNQ